MYLPWSAYECPAASWLHLRLVVNGAFDNRRDVLGSLRVCDRCGSNCYAEVVSFDMPDLEERRPCQGEQILVPSYGTLKALLYRQA
jgi:hypothetical protein